MRDRVHGAECWRNRLPILRPPRMRNLGPSFENGRKVTVHDAVEVLGFHFHWKPFVHAEISNLPQQVTGVTPPHLAVAIDVVSLNQIVDDRLDIPALEHLAVDLEQQFELLWIGVTDLDLVGNAP